MLDLIIRGGTLPDGRVCDIAIAGDRIADIAPRIDGTAAQEIDATGDLVSPPFVDPHFHMDATLSYGTPRVNASGTLLEGIDLWGNCAIWRPWMRWLNAPCAIAIGRRRWGCWQSGRT